MIIHRLLSNDGHRVELTYNPDTHTVKYTGEENLTWELENLTSNWANHFKLVAKDNLSYYLGLDESTNDILRQWYGAVVLEQASGGMYTIKGDSNSNGNGHYLGWNNGDFAAVNSNPISVYIAKVEPIDEIDTSDIRVDDRVHYIVTDHYVGGNNAIRANRYLGPDDQPLSFASNPTEEQEYAGNLTVYDYGLTGNTSTQSGLTSFNTYLATNNNGAPDSAFNQGGGLNQEFTDAKNFLDSLNGPSTGGTGLDWTEETFIATAADKSALTTIFRDIANKIAKNLTEMTVVDYIDPRFELVDANNEPITVGDHPELGFTVGYDADRDMQYVKWIGQDIPTNNVMDNTVVGAGGQVGEISLWSQTIRVRAKDDFLGGNEVLSNANVENLNKVYPDGHPEETSEKTSRTFPRTTVDPKVLELELGETEDTLYLGEVIDASEHSTLEDAIGDTVDSEWYYEYLDRYGDAANTDYIARFK